MEIDMTAVVPLGGTLDELIAKAKQIKRIGAPGTSTFGLQRAADQPGEVYELAVAWQATVTETP